MKQYKLYTLILLIAIYGCNSTVQQKSNKKTESNDYFIAHTKTIIENLPHEINETSGLIYFDSLFWTNNDSGGEACLYGFSETNGEIVRKVCLSGVKNIDWEELTENDDNIFIGDFGNNNGNRKNLCIYIIKKDDILSDSVKAIVPEKITFKWEDQTDYSRAHHATAFDCEAFFCVNDSLFLFAKDWAGNKTRMYYLPAKAGDYIAQKLNRFNVDGLITGVDISDDRSEIVMVGYKEYKSFIWFFNDFSNHDFLSGKAERFNLFQFDSVQTEAVCYHNNMVYISCEESATPAALFTLDRK